MGRPSHYRGNQKNVHLLTGEQTKRIVDGAGRRRILRTKLSDPGVEYERINRLVKGRNRCYKNPGGENALSNLRVLRV